MQVLYERCAATDADKDVIAVAVGLPAGDGPDGRAARKRTFKTVLRGAPGGGPVAGLAGGHARGVEATGISSMPACHALVEHGSFRAGASAQRRTGQERAGPQDGFCRC